MDRRIDHRTNHIPYCMKIASLAQKILPVEHGSLLHITSRMRRTSNMPESGASGLASDAKSTRMTPTGHAQH
jgi:hypothetical protein